ncbi:MAG: nuclear transport factor 2 family protein [Acidiferrobacterales bacterium]|nr:nuclear transport factor 2 family protein [Acidiferrobacterales bacterium]
MKSRSVVEVFEDHLALAQRGDVETDLARNFAPDCVLLTSYGVFHGHDGARRAAQLLDEQIGKTTYIYRTKLFHGELAFLEWSASTDRAWIEDGADSYWIHDGRIRVMTAHYTVHPRKQPP